MCLETGLILCSHNEKKTCLKGFSHSCPPASAQRSLYAHSEHLYSDSNSSVLLDEALFI